MKPSVVVFDIGGVLVDWQPHLAFTEELGEQGARDFLVRTDFLARNLRGDKGERFADMARELADPEDAALFARYVERYTRTVQNALHATWDILDALKSNGTEIHAITNWSAETWPEGLKVHPRLGEVFGVTVVSGQEQMLKPQPEIFHLLCARAGVAPEDCVFTDDGLHNVDGARAVGMDGIHFTSAQALAEGLRDRGLL